MHKVDFGIEFPQRKNVTGSSLNDGPPTSRLNTQANEPPSYEEAVSQKNEHLEQGKRKTSLSMQEEGAVPIIFTPIRFTVDDPSETCSNLSFNRPNTSESQQSKINVFRASISELPSNLFLNLPSNISVDEYHHNTHHEYKSDLKTSWIDKELPGLWGHHGLELKPWDDKDRPLIRLREHHELKLTPAEEEGLLTERIIAACSSYLNRSPEINKYVICKIDLSLKMLRNISVLKYYHYVQNLDLSNNEIKCLEPLGEMPFLMYLNASHNDLTEVLDFKPPFNLTYVDLSSNYIQHIPDLTEFWSLVYLNLSHNKIRAIEGLENLKYLRFLSLSYNQISVVENLNNMRLQTLNLQNNVIYKYECGPNVGLKTLNYLKHIDLSQNHLDSLKIFQNVSRIQNVDMCNNHVNNIIDLYYFKYAIQLSCLHLKNNPVCNVRHYFAVCLNAVPSLLILDGEYIKAEERAQVIFSFEKPFELKAAQMNADTLLLKQINNPHIGLSIFPYTSRPPTMVILVGPPSSRKSVYVKKICSEMPKYAIKAISHTTRMKNEDEIEDEDYHYVPYETFRNMLRHGEFLTMTECLGHCYGISKYELGKVVGTSAALILHSNLSAALMLRAKGFKPVLVLCMPRTEETHYEWLENMYHHEIIAPGMKRVENCPEKVQQKRYIHLSNSNIKNDSKEKYDEDIEVMFSGERLGKYINADMASTTEITSQLSYSSLENFEQHEESSTLNFTAEDIENYLPIVGNSLGSSIIENKNTAPTNLPHVCRSNKSGSIDNIMSDLGASYVQDANCLEKTETNGNNPQFVVSTNSCSTDISTSQLRDFDDYQSTDSTHHPVASAYFNNSTQGSYRAQLGILKKEDKELKKKVSVTFRSEDIHHADSDTQEVYNKSKDLPKSISQVGDLDILEHDLFTSISEYGVTDKEPEEKSTVSDNYEYVYFEGVIDLRKIYLEVHIKNPGLFNKMIFTDDEEQSMATLKEIVKDALKLNHTNTEPIYDLHKDPLYKTMVAERLKAMSRQSKIEKYPY